MKVEHITIKKALVRFEKIISEEERNNRKFSTASILAMSNKVRLLILLNYKGKNERDIIEIGENGIVVFS